MGKSRTVGLAVAAAGVLVGLVMPAAPASADALQAHTACEALGESRLACDAWATGGTAPFTYAWSLGSSFGGQSISFGCFPGSRRTITVTITDATGAVSSASSSPLCIGGPPR
jgi:hypothetical protein